MDVTLTPTALPDVLVLETRVFRDDRGLFLETFSQRDFARAGLDLAFVQDNHSRSRGGVLRGLHYQDLSAPMGKLVRCTRGAVLDVAVDLRVGAPTFAQWAAVELSEDNQRQLWVPAGFAHGFLALTEWADLQYRCTNYYTPAAERVLRWDDPEVGIAWPHKAPLLSARDAGGESLAQYRARPAFNYPLPAGPAR